VSFLLARHFEAFSSREIPVLRLKARFLLPPVVEMTKNSHTALKAKPLSSPPLCGTDMQKVSDAFKGKSV
jgi:hypothetical protein